MYSSGGGHHRSVRSEPVRLSSASGNMGAVPPPAALTAPNAVGLNSVTAREFEKRKEEEYAALMTSGGSISGKATVAGPRKKKIYDDEYLERDSDDDELMYQPNPGSPNATRGKGQTVVEDDEEDPLDIFMDGVNKQAEADKILSVIKDNERRNKTVQDLQAEEEQKKDKGLGRTDIDEEDMQESYFNYLEEHKSNGPEDEESYEYDEDGNIIWSWKKVIDPLPPIDHSTVEYKPFNKNFYSEHEQIKAMSSLKVFELRNKLNIKIAGFNPPKPATSFAHFGFDDNLMSVIRKSEYEHPTPIQAQALPAALSGRDVLGIAKTGSGKTVAYLWPAIIHIMDQPDLKEGDGPIALVVVPTRELAIQVYHEAKRYCKVYNLEVVCAYGGGSKWEQQNALKNGSELVIATPGRIIDLVKIDATNFSRVTFLVFDEADRMFDMGFEAQVLSIANHIRPDRQCLMFSATFKAKVERLAREALNDPIRIVQGEVGEANADIDQIVEVLPNNDAKWTWLQNRLVQLVSLGKVLIFVTRKQNSEDVAQRLRKWDFKLVLLHGDMLQAERNEKLSSFRKDIPIMVATDVAARGLDIPEIRTVINFDIARDIDTHVHRIGRTGRAGQKGWAYTLVTETDKEMLGHLVQNLESVNQPVPDALLQLALKSSWFRSARNKQEGNLGQGRQRLGLGFKPKIKSGGSSVTSAMTARALSCGGSTGSSAVRTAIEKLPPGPVGGTSRLQAMKAAFKSTYKSTFRASSSNEWLESRAPPTDPRPEWKKKLDEAAAAVNKELTGSSQGSAGGDDHPNEPVPGPTFGQKKRSSCCFIDGIKCSYVYLRTSRRFKSGFRCRCELICLSSILLSID
ncbi:hypothetical protein AB6A40_003260 [Gnathostoma spinigerum]|uniref:RNA helicase n=1 Tax=Gnathostoma spinigerum TaxID=75299 RepID=A0ABD6EA99_9BILA